MKSFEESLQAIVVVCTKERLSYRVTEQQKMAEGGPGPPTRNEYQFPELPQVRHSIFEEEPRFIKIKGAMDKSLKDVSPFSIAKSIERVTGRCLQSWMERKSGHLCVQVKNLAAAERLLRMKCIRVGSNEEIPVEIVSCDNLNQSKVLVYCESVINESESVIVKEMADQKVVAVRRITKLVDGKPKNTPLLILTIDSICPPEYLKVGLVRVKTRPYFPKPMRCFNCLKFGHIKDKCDKEKVCQNCSGSFHGNECENVPKCVNCGQQHATMSKVCPATQKEESICKIKVHHRVSFPEARRIFESSVKNTTYAEAARIDIEKLQKRMDDLEKTVSEQVKMIAEKDLLIEKQAREIESLKKKLELESEKNINFESSNDLFSSDVEEESVMEIVQVSKTSAENKTCKRKVKSRNVESANGHSAIKDHGNFSGDEQNRIPELPTSSSSENTGATKKKHTKLEGHGQSGAGRGKRSAKSTTK